MITIDLDSETERRLRQLAESLAQEVSALAGRVLQEYLEHFPETDDSAEQWADASVAPTPELLVDES